MGFAVWLFLTKLTKIYSGFYTVESIYIVLVPYLREVLKGRESGFEPQYALTSRGKKMAVSVAVTACSSANKTTSFENPPQMQIFFPENVQFIWVKAPSNWQLEMKIWGFWFSCPAETGAPFNYHRLGVDVYDWNSSIMFQHDAL